VRISKSIACIGVIVIISFGCQKPKPTVIEEVSLPGSTSSLGNSTLSSYNFFKGELRDLAPNEGIVPYQLNSSLFTDYAFKKRFIKFPTGTFASYHPSDVLQFPEGTVLIKNFFYPADFRKPEENIRIVETRLLILESGNWKTLPYIWNDEQTEAYLDVAGKNIPIEWTHIDGSKKQVLYSVPNMNQCKSCHMKGDKIAPIGPTARQLNGDMNGKNQLEQLATLGLVHDLPPLNTVPKLAAYDDEKVALNDRARAWLEVNCAHCHRSDGPAKTSGLHLLADVSNSYELGIGKAPVAAGRGSGGRSFDIIPGKPDESILYYRINSVDPGVMMPELGKKLIHEEGVALIKEWIEKMQSQ